MTQQTAPATTSDVTVTLDDRVRLMSAVLAATDFPEKSQKLKPHGTHAHARATRKYLKDHGDHPAVKSAQALLDQGAPLEALFAIALFLDATTLEPTSALPSWMPANWNEQLKAFHAEVDLAGWWKKEQSVWNKAQAECQKVFGTAQFKDFLAPFLPPVPEELVFIPNISYPTDRDIGLRQNNQLICIAAPPLAWGDSPPWPYDEDTMIMYVFKSALAQYVRILLMTYLRANPEAVEQASQTELPVNDQFRAQFPSWEGQFIELFVTAVTAMYIEQFVSEMEYKSFVLMERKVRGMNILPGTVSVLGRYLQEKGNKYDTLIEFLPLFPKQLRVAKRIVTL